MRVGRGVVLLPLVLLAACTAGPSVRPGIVVNDGGGQPVTTASSEPGPAPLPPLNQPNPGRSIWGPCSPEVLQGITTTPGIDLTCGKVTGTLDSPYAPGRGGIRLQALRAGTGPIPLVVVNEVDGLPGTHYAAALAAKLPPDLLAKFSLVGLDRRGTGSSDPVRCVPEEVRFGLLDADPRALDLEGLVDQARTAGQQCSIALETRLPAIDTWRTAGDVESLRISLGMDKLHAIGHGEGSRVLSVYAERYPDRVGRMVLDGAPDPNEDAVVALEGVAAGADATFAAFADDCAKRACELGANARQALTEILDRAASSPLVTDDIDLTPGLVLRAVQHGLADRANWPSLAVALANARSGDPTRLAAAVTPLVLESEDVPATFDATLVTRCNDTKSRLSTEALTAASKDWNTRYPLFGALTAEWLAVCSPWPVPSHPVPTATARTAPPLVVLATAVDPLTPLSGTERAAQQLATAVLISWQGTGHGALGYSPCATEAAQAFLLDGTVPRDGTVCPP
ncbi:pimeloyl-ACP methyl ester carboxylesterase [Actinokineospora baliensis]|uniref:alpha/beta hydrolase n=1 Tax=Actinokineospora baliensis TaxID=547056 RepID=UPI00195E56DA|nr:alpha/beta hydrolase [Actinokineospora baliensis]MBM7776247.1 pimeloyl-ACP methyl ester carboxylesterase [Actinokineospora baliensis]